jgi:hypothetical protein
VRLFARYLLRQCALLALLALSLAASLVFLLQLLRLGHHLAATFSAPLLVQALGLSLPTLCASCLPLSLAAALTVGLGRLAERGELEALLAAGAAPRQLAAPLLLLALFAAGLGALAARLEPAALSALGRLATASAAQAIWRGAPPRRFHELGGATVYFEARDGHGRELRLERLLLALDDPPLVAVARTARVTIDPAGAATLGLERGELHSLPPEPWRRVGFETATFSLDLRPSLAAELGFLAGLGGRSGWAERALRTAASSVTLALLALALALRPGPARLRRAGLGLALAAAYSLASWGAALGAGPAGALALDLVLGVSGWVLIGGRGRPATC